MSDLKSVEKLIKKLDSKKEATRERAVKKLERIFYPTFAPPGKNAVLTGQEVKIIHNQHYSRLHDSPLLTPLLQALESGGKYAKIFSATALGAANEIRALPLLRNVLKDDSADVRTAAAKGLGLFPDIDSVIPLIDLLQDSNIEVRSASARTLGSIGDKRAVSPLLKMLENNNRQDKWNALIALGDIGDIDSLPFIRAYLKDKDKKIRKPAKFALATYDRKRRKILGNTNI